MESSEDVPVPPKESRIVRKGPQELAAQMIKVYGVDLKDYQVPNAQKLKDQYTEWRSQVRGLLEDRADNQTLTTTLDRIYSEGKRMGVYKASVGENRAANLEAVTKYYEGWKNFGEVPEEIGERELEKQGYVVDLRLYRKWDERDFNEKLTKFVDTHPLAQVQEQEKIKALQKRTVDLDRLTEADLTKLRVEFIGGNFVYHGARAEEIIKVLGDGELLNFKAVWEREEQRAKAEGRDKESLSRNSGYEGISWSMNRINAMPGDRYHLAGFLGSPVRILQEGQQFAVPSRPAPYEVIQINGDIDVNRFYGIKTQAELLEHMTIFGESPSVLDNLMAVRRELKSRAEDAEKEKPQKRFFDEPQLFVFTNKYTDAEILEHVRGKYSVGADGSVEISPELVQQFGEPLPPGAIWIQMLLDTGRIKQVAGFEDAKIVREVVDRITEENSMALLDELRKDRAMAQKQLEEETKITDLAVSVEDLYFVTSRLDLPKWLKVIARCDSQPRGIIVYDHKKVRLENWASEHIGHSEVLTQELQKGIRPDPENGYIDWESQILGEQLSEVEFTGTKRQVISEKSLTHRKTIRKDPQGNFVIA